MRYALLPPFTLLCVLASGQEFNIVHLSANDGASRGTSVREAPEGYLVLSNRFDDSLTYRVHTEIFGPDGTFISQHGWVDAAESSVGVHDAASRTLPDGGMLASVSVRWPDSMQWRAYRFNAAHDTVWTRTLRSGVRIFPRTAAHQAGMHYYTALIQDTADAEAQAWVARVDDLGALHDLVTIPWINYDGLSLTAGAGTDLLLTGGRTSSLFPYRSSVVLLDTALQVLWSRDIVTDLPGFGGCSSYVSKVTADASGDILVAGTCYYEYTTPGIPLAEFYLLKLAREDGAVIWSHRFPISISDFGSLNDLECLPDGDLVACGVNTPGDIGFQGCIQRYSPDGTERWRRYYHFLTNPDAYNELVDVEQTSDGGFVLTGTTQISLSFPTVLWLLRLDAYGCLEPGCQNVGIDELVIGLPDEALRCSPVPAKDRLTMTIDLPVAWQTHGSLRVSITDITGRMVHQMDLGNISFAVTDVDVSSWDRGAYVVHLADGTALLGSRRILVQ